MAKVSIVSLQISNKRIIKAKNVTSVMVSNLSKTATSFIFNGIVRRLPAIDTDTLLPVQPFQISDNGHHFDIELNFNQPSKKLILDYTEIVKEKDKCN